MKVKVKPPVKFYVARLAIKVYDRRILVDIQRGAIYSLDPTFSNGEIRWGQSTSELKEEIEGKMKETNVSGDVVIAERTVVHTIDRMEGR